MASNGVLRVLWKGFKGFLSFWKNFLIGDSPVLALGVIIIVGVAYLLHDSAILAPISTIVLVLVLMVFSVWQRTKT
jgi:hypothetical protein